MATFTLQRAVQDGDEELAKMLLLRGANIEANEGVCGTPLVCAVEARQINMVQWLLDQGADPNAPGGRFGFPLQAAAVFGEIEIAQTLLHHGAEVNAEGGFHRTATHAAAWEERQDMVALLLANNANITMRDGRSGADLGAATVIQMLLDDKADTNRREDEELLHQDARRDILGMLSTLLYSRGNPYNSEGPLGSSLQATKDYTFFEIVLLIGTAVALGCNGA